MRVALTFLLLLSSFGYCQSSLKDKFEGYFYVGAALNQAQIEGRDDLAGAIIAANFDTITPENVLKWKAIHPHDGEYNFAPGDAYVRFGEEHHMVVIGHTLIWHESTPKWVFEDSSGRPATRDVVLRRMRDHIYAVVGRYKGRIRGWDVVNEALNDDGTMRDSPWRQIIGDDYVEKAFQFAHEADPQAELYYNEYMLEKPEKRKGAIALIRRLQAKGLRVDAVGIQSHESMTWPTTAELENAIVELGQLNVKVNITELDVDVLPNAGGAESSPDVSTRAKPRPELDPYAQGLPQAVQQQLATRYADLFLVFLRHRGDITRVTFWGVTDATSWRNNSPVRGRTNYPLLFDRAGRPKAAYDAVLKMADDQRAENERKWSGKPAYLNPELSAETRAADLVSRMTLEEEITQVVHTASAIPRLRVPEYNWWNEGLHGVARAGVATVFPQAIGMAATFDEALVHDVADVISTEFRAKYYSTLKKDGGSEFYRGLTVWSPNINIFRDPRWGRGQETYGEDPYLTARLASAFITGLQGSDPNYWKTLATSKHFAVHSGPESTRHSVDVKASAHDMEDTYLPAFRATLTEAHAHSVMCAYNSLNGEPACANSDLLEKHLRSDWKFQGYVVSDCGAVTDIAEGHKFAPSLPAAAADAFRTGTDLFCDWPLQNNAIPSHNWLRDAVDQKFLPKEVLDRSVTRLFNARIKLGMFDPTDRVSYSRIASNENDSPAHEQLALRAARESIVLLKNENGTLPLKKTPGNIAVIGPDADSVDVLVGNYNGDPARPVTLLSGIRKRYPDANVVYKQGSGIVGPADDPADAQSALNAARRADLVIVALGLSPHVEGEEMKIEADGFSGGDRTAIDLPKPQEHLLEQLASLGKPLVLVLLNGSALSINWADRHVPSILEAWYPGEQGGTAIAEAIAGDFSPAGRLPVTFYESVEQIPPFDDYSMANRTYRYFKGNPLYPFGYGLSYTSFRYSNARVNSSNFTPGQTAAVSVDVQNIGAVDGDEVVQLYASHQDINGAPLRSLAGFQRVHLARGETVTVSFALRDRDLSIVDIDGIRRLVPGTVKLWLGGGQPEVHDTRHAAPGALTSINLNAAATLPR